MAIFMEWIAYLQYLGVADVLIPFFLIFAVAFGVLQNAKVFGNDSKKFNLIISLAMGFAVVIPHVMWGTRDPTYPYLTTGVVDIVKLINNSLPEVAAVLVGIIMIALLLGAVGKKWVPANNGGWLLPAIILGIVIYIFASNAGYFDYPYWLWWLNDYETQMLLVTLLVFGIVVWAITKSDDGPKKGSEDWVRARKESALRGLFTLGDLNNSSDDENP